MDRPWSIGAGGEVFFLGEPHASPIRVESIAHSLAGINRFNGHGRHRGPTADGRIYSVLEHSVIVGQIAFHLVQQTRRPDGGLRLSPCFARGLGALHDAHEAYTGDMNYSAKVLLRRTTTAWDEFEHAWESIVREYFLGPTWDQQWQAYAEIVKRADTIALLAERRVLLPAGPRYPHEETLSRQDLDYARDLAPSLAAPFGPSLHATWLAQLTDAGIGLEGWRRQTAAIGGAP